ncbi:YcaO-like family protein [Serratia marcescens]|uniref:YcaO-like family protein n=1 Tax=Serratia marcescens TaxID=615 RepID=UPI003F7E660E
MTQTFIPGKDAALEDSIARFQQKLSDLGFNIEEASWLNPVPHVWSVHIRDRDCPLCFTNGKGASKKAALASALGEYFERLSTNYFFADFYLGKQIAEGDFVHYPNEKWFPIPEDDALPAGILDERLHAFYDPQQELSASDLVDLQSGNADRGVCALPFTRQSDQQTVYIPMNIIGNLYVSNGMSAGNTANEARVQGLSEVFERYVKNRIIAESISLPAIPDDVLNRYPGVVEAIAKLEEEGFPILSYDASLGGNYPVICVVLFNPTNGTCFASFGAHPDFGVALERTVTELLGIASGKDNAWHTLRVGELKAMLALAGGDLDQALIWTEWTQDFNASVLSPARSNYYRCLQTLLLLAQEPEREAAQYYTAFVKMYGQEAVDAASAAISGEERFNGLFAVDADLKALPAHQALLAAYEKLQAAKRRHWAKA